MKVFNDGKDYVIYKGIYYRLDQNYNYTYTVADGSVHSFKKYEELPEAVQRMINRKK
jgi:hypothetical protein